jgi:accessory gene regulator B
MIQKLIAVQASWLAKKLDYGKSEEEILNYSLNLVFTIILGYGLLTIAAGLLGVLPTALAAAVSASVLRSFSGGAHASRISRCVVLGAVIFSAIGWLAAVGIPGLEESAYSDIMSLKARVFIIMIIVIGTGIIYFFAPAPAPSKPKQTHLQEVVMISCSLVLLWWWGATVWLINSMQWGIKHQEVLLASQLGIVWQLFSLTPWGFGLLRVGEKFIDFLFRINSEKG